MSRESYQSLVGRSDDGRRVFKQLKAGAISPEEFGAEEWGLLYLYCPWVLPDVERGDRGAT